MKRLLSIGFLVSILAALSISAESSRADVQTGPSPAGFCTPGGRLCCPSDEQLEACYAAPGYFDYGLCKCIPF
jgi:hypothetical protein